jgi:hypothetical protein
VTSNVDDFGVARAQAAQFMAYGAGIAWIVEPLLALMIRRPEATPAGIPAGDPRIGPGSTGLVALKSRQKRVTSAVNSLWLKVGSRKFALDSSLGEDGFELSVPGDTIKVLRSLHVVPANIKSARTSSDTGAPAVGDRLPVVAHRMNGGAIAGQRDHRLGLGTRPTDMRCGCWSGSRFIRLRRRRAAHHAHVAVCWGFGPEFLLGSGLELVGRAD